MKRAAFVALAAAAASIAGRVRAAGRASVPFELLANAIYVPVRVGERGPLLFAIDTGAATSIVASEYVSSLHLSPHGSVGVTGEGSDAAAPLLGALNFDIGGGIVANAPSVSSVSLAELWPLIGRPYEGAIGSDALRAYVLEIDYANRVLTFHDPHAYRYDGNGTWFDATLWNGYDPQITGRLEVAGGRIVPVRCTLDTGASQSIAAAPLVEDAGLTRAAGKTLAVPNHGVGNGQSVALLARFPRLRVGSYDLDAPLIALSQDSGGAFASRSLSLDLGGDVLRRFTVTIDYPGNRVALEPNRYLADRFEADASGLFVAAEGADYRTFAATDVLPASPASDAGIVAGDTIVAVDAVPASAYALWQLMERFARPGIAISLNLRRGAETFVRNLLLRALI